MNSKMQVLNAQILEFLAQIRKELLKIVANFDKKTQLIRKDLTGTLASVNCTLDHNQTEKSLCIGTSDQLFFTVIEGAKKIIESLAKRIESFVNFSYQQNGTHKRQTQSADIKPLG